MSRHEVKWVFVPFQVPKNPDLGSNAERTRKDEQQLIDDSEPLDEDELFEKEELLQQVKTIYMYTI